MTWGWPVLAAALLAAGCVRRPPPVRPVPHYVVGPGYEAAGTWFYPREDFHYEATGLASVMPISRGLTADGEAADATAMTAAHQTLQLPAVARVTNLETGLQVLLRVNDRGPASPARLIALSPRAAALLGMAGNAAQVRVEVDEGPSLALREQLRGGPRLDVAAAPRDAVRAETLAPPPGTGQSARGRTAAVGPVFANTPSAPVALVPDRLPETVQRVMAFPGRLMIAAGSFGQPGYARRVAGLLSAIGAGVAPVQEGRTTQYRVRAGPFGSVAEADFALDQAMRAGVTDARIVVE